MIETIEQLSTNKSTATLPSPLQALERLSWNYWWSWSTDGAGVFRDLDAELWDQVEHNPRMLLAQVSEYRLAEMATDPVYSARIIKLSEQFDEYMRISDLRSQIPDLKSEIPNLKSESTITSDNPVAYFLR
jgi:starch phosphorylase